MSPNVSWCPLRLPNVSYIFYGAYFVFFVSLFFLYFLYVFLMSPVSSWFLLCLPGVPCVFLMSPVSSWCPLCLPIVSCDILMCPASFYGSCIFLMYSVSSWFLLCLSDILGVFLMSPLSSWHILCLPDDWSSCLMFHVYLGCVIQCSVNSSLFVNSLRLDDTWIYSLIFRSHCNIVTQIDSYSYLQQFYFMNIIPTCRYYNSTNINPIHKYSS